MDRQIKTNIINLEEIIPSEVIQQISDAVKSQGLKSNEENIIQERTKKPRISLAEHDKYLTQIEKQLEEKRNFLLNKRKVLKKLSSENKYLNSVKQEYYDQYHDYVVKQKENQIKAMNLLNNYIKDIIVSGELTEQDIKNTRAEQKDLIQQIEKIKNDLSELTE
jgi:hypothetical protein